MKARALPPLLALGAFVMPCTVVAQGMVVDQGRFSVTVDGRAVGAEDFTIRRAGIGRDDAIFANAVVQFTGPGAHEVRPLLRATPPDGIASSYQVEVTGRDELDLQLQLARRRYVAIITSAAGEEHREFPALAGTRILERDVAHHYYFLRGTREGSTTPVLEPRSRSRYTLETGPATDEELRIGRSVVSARRVEFSAGEDRRIVWYDQLGRVLRVSLPDRDYLAERTDLFR